MNRNTASTILPDVLKLVGKELNRALRDDDGDIYDIKLSLPSGFDAGSTEGFFYSQNNFKF